MQCLDVRNIQYHDLAGMIDHSLLHPALTDLELIEGCQLAARYRVASVCIKPYAVPLAVEALAGTGVKVGTVAGFPHGSEPLTIKLKQIEWAAQAQAKEIDVVLNLGYVFAERWRDVEHEAKALCEQAHQHGLIIKLILETGLLPTDQSKIQLCTICAEAGADFVKTSTGFGFVPMPDGRYICQGATEHDVKLLRTHCPAHVGVKAAGGIRTLQQLIRMRELGASRCGMTATAKVMDQFISLTGLDCSSAETNRTNY